MRRCAAGQLLFADFFFFVFTELLCGPSAGGGSFFGWLFWGAVLAVGEECAFFARCLFFDRIRMSVGDRLRKLGI